MHRIEKFMWASIYECMNAYNIWTGKVFVETMSKTAKWTQFFGCDCRAGMGFGTYWRWSCTTTLEKLDPTFANNCNNRRVPVLILAFQETKRNWASKTLESDSNHPKKGICEHNSQIFLLLNESICMWHPQDGVLSIALLHSSWIPVDCCRYASCCSSFNDLGFCTASFAFTSRFRGRSAGDVGPNGTAGCVLDPMGLGQTTLSTEQLGSETRPMVTMVITWCEYCTLGLCYNATKTSCNVHGDLVQSFSGEDAFSYSTGWKCCESCFLLIRNKLCDATLSEITPSMLSFHSGFLLGFHVCQLPFCTDVLMPCHRTSPICCGP